MQFPQAENQWGLFCQIPFPNFIQSRGPQPFEDHGLGPGEKISHRPAGLVMRTSGRSGPNHGCLAGAHVPRSLQGQGQQGSGLPSWRGPAAKAPWTGSGLQTRCFGPLSQRTYAHFKLINSPLFCNNGLSSALYHFWTPSPSAYNLKRSLFLPIPTSSFSSLCTNVLDLNSSWAWQLHTNLQHLQQLLFQNGYFRKRVPLHIKPVHKLSSI